VTRPERIIILGGGTAGWMAANLFAHHWPEAAVTLVESPEVGIIGVGEGSTPQLRAFFRTLGIAERDWMPKCNATYKNGIRFTGWSERAGFGSYYHPFHTDLDGRSLDAFTYNTRARRTGRDVEAHPDAFFLPTRLSAERRAPLPAESFPFDVGYGYHFDAYLVGAFLREHAKARRVDHLERHVITVDVAPDGRVRALNTREGERIGGDLFVDASGFRGTIVQQALGTRFLPFGENLFNDRAVVMPTPNTGATNPHTTATAMSAGWVWHIPLTSRTGNGYVYSSRYIDDDDAETELRRHLGTLDDPTLTRRLEMKVGRVETTWTGNCLAIGLAQGFIEPLEATALHIVQATVEGFIDTDGDPAQRKAFNARIARRYEGIRDYIVCHYKVSQRTGSPYWRDAAALDTLSDELKSVLTAWYRGADLVAEIDRLGIAPFYSALSWHCLLAGYGTFPDDAKIGPPGDDIARHDMTAIDDFLRRCALNFEPHDAALAALCA